MSAELTPWPRCKPEWHVEPPSHVRIGDYCYPAAASVEDRHELSLWLDRVEQDLVDTREYTYGFGYPVFIGLYVAGMAGTVTSLQLVGDPTVMALLLPAFVLVVAMAILVVINRSQRPQVHALVNLRADYKQALDVNVSAGTERFGSRGSGRP